MNIGDLVTRKSYNYDLDFIIRNILNNNAILTGLDYRLIADSHISDLEYLQKKDNLNEKNIIINGDINNYEFRNQSNENLENYYSINYESKISMVGQRYGKVLHIDGDKSYLKECLAQYKKLGVSTIGVCIKESKQPEIILKLLKKYNPNILVITGHDSISNKNKNSIDLNDYRNSKYFVNSIKIARQHNSNYDDLVIIAGGCKSNYEALMNAGANFASSPNRILINVTDPVYIACKLATTSIEKFLDMDILSKDIFSSIDGIGGIQTRGQCRSVKPNF